MLTYDIVGMRGESPQAVVHNKKTFSLDNRRLWCLKARSRPAGCFLNRVRTSSFLHPPWPDGCSEHTIPIRLERHYVEKATGSAFL